MCRSIVISVLEGGCSGCNSRQPLFYSLYAIGEVNHGRFHAETEAVSGYWACFLIVLDSQVLGKFTVAACCRMDRRFVTIALLNICKHVEAHG